ncbi:MAG: hypothetical protein REI64_17415 [Pedobacter sp.]|uniref:DUF6850 family outer membrane beta-barrel protein n=1 Tax=Pedobacter sp. TaxID=1411316 RepID=UPI002808957E|nr:DUF6850 family outer membrane beta-barrel protein [Pedobacter sp.]MDQ8006586.1 hypothetical protein [Pedobacter sp.]
MRFKLLICRLIVFFGGVCCSANLIAQQQIDTVFTDIDYIRKSNTWLSSSNASGLRFFSLPKISTAKIFLNKDNGEFKNFHQTDNSYTYGLSAESIYRLNPKVVFLGNVTYSTFTGNNMGGSSFMDPYLNSFDIVELDDANKGIKQLETYGLTGAVSTQLTSKFTIGGSIDYQASNFAKMKDLRHINKLLNLGLSIGGLYEINDKVEFGLNYNYDRRIESIAFRSYGNTDRQFISLISFGSFYGRSELFDRYGYTSGENSTPMTNFNHGAAFQLNIKLDKKIRYLNEFTFSILKGFYGQDGTASVLYTQHGGNNYSYNGTLSIIGTKTEQYISISANHQTLVNNENVYRRETTTGGVSRIVYYGQSEVLDKQQLSAHLHYTLFKNVQNRNPRWEVNLSTGYFRRQQTTTIYPFYRDQTINSYQANANLKRNIIKANRIYSFAVGLGYGSGSGIAKYDGLYATPSASQVAPTSMDLYLYQEFEYFTKPRVMANLSLQYTKKLKQNIAPYAKLNYNYTKAFDTQFLGNSFGIAGASVGCNF